MENTTKSEVGAGARAMAPVLAGLVPAGIAVGAAWSGAGLPAGPGVVAAATVYGASGQLIVIDLGARGAALGVVALMSLAASMRLALLGVGLGRRLCGASVWSRWLAAALLVSPSYLVADARFRTPSTRAERWGFYLGAGATLWVGWQVAHVAGLLLGSVIPDAAALDFALPLCLLGLLVPQLHGGGARAAALTAGVTAVVARSAPLGSGVLVAVVVGVAVGRGWGGSR